jgi:hypothetical protein
MSSPPNFWALFAQALELSASRRSIIAFLPWWLLLCCVFPAVAVYLMGSLLRPSIPDSGAVTMSAIAVVGGFFGSVSIATMTQVQRMASEYPFSSYLREQRIFDLFLFWPQYTLLTQICLIVISTVGAAAVRMFNLGEVDRYIVATDIGLLIYACTKTWKLVDLIRNLTWHYEEYQRLLAEQRASVNSGQK